jgi:hypothetical protein
MDQLAANNYRAQTLIRAIVMSPAFTAPGSGPSPAMPHRDAISSQIAANQTATREAKTNE